MAGIANLFIFTYYGLEIWYKHKKKISSLCCSLSPWRTQPRECIFVPASPSPLHRPPPPSITPPISISSPAIYDVQSWTISWLDAFLDQTIKEPILVSHSPAGPPLFFLNTFMEASPVELHVYYLSSEEHIKMSIMVGHSIQWLVHQSFWTDKDLLSAIECPLS